MNGILITGTHKDYVLSLGTKYNGIAHCSYYTVVNAKNHTPHSVQLSPYAASMIKAYIQSQLTSSNAVPINTVVLCIQTPQHNNFLHEVSQKDIDSIFRTEWFFILDMIRHSINLLQKQSHIHPLLLISIFPTQIAKTHTYACNTSDLFSQTLRSAIKTFSKHFSKIKIITSVQKTNNSTHINILQKLIQKKSYKTLPKNNSYRDVSKNKPAGSNKLNFILKKIISSLKTH